MVVGADGKVAPRHGASSAPAQGNDWVVLEGLKAGEQVMVDGFQKLRRCAGHAGEAGAVAAAGAAGRASAAAPAAAAAGGAEPLSGARSAWPSSSSTARSSRG